MRYFHRFFVPLAFLSLLFGMVACSEDESSDPVAEIRFMHDVDDQGELEILIDTDVVATLKPGEMSKVIKTEPGSRVRLALRSPGVAQPIQDLQVDLEAIPYFIAFTGSVGSGDLQTFQVAEVKPELDDTQAAVSGVSLYDASTSFDLYVDNILIKEGLSYAQQPSYVVVPSGYNTIKVHNAGDEVGTAVPVASMEVSFDKNSANMILIQGTSGSAPTIEVVTMD